VKPSPRSGRLTVPWALQLSCCAPANPVNTAIKKKKQMDLRTFGIGELRMEDKSSGNIGQRSMAAKAKKSIT
jgi:hypothetical protein